MMLRDYLVGKRDKDPNIVELCKLALKTTLTDDVLVSIRKSKPGGCVNCGRTCNPAPFSSPTKGHVDVVLMCDRCGNKEEMDISAIVLDLADADKVETCFLWRDAKKVIRVLTNDLRTEVISAKG